MLGRLTQGGLRVARQSRAATPAVAVPVAGVRWNTTRVVLVKQVDNVGHLGEEVEVKAGFARNFLLWRRLAVPATAETRAKFKVELPAEQREMLTEVRRRNRLKARVEAVALQFNRATRDGVELYGPIGRQELLEAFEETTPHIKLNITAEDFRVPEQKRANSTDHQLPNAGEYTIQVQAAPSLWCDVTVFIFST